MKPIILLCIIMTLFSCSSSNSVVKEDAKFIFRANVESINAATLPEIKDVSKCIVVKVNKVLVSPPEFKDWEGRLITVATEKINSHKPAVEMLFYTNGWLYGKSLAVVEISSMDSNKITDGEVIESILQQENNKVKKRLKESDLVVSGEVVEIKETDSRNIRSEHHPYWTTAIIKVDSYEKGGNGEFLEFKFALSTDIMWQNAPKFKEGDKGIWLFKSKDNETVLEIKEKEKFYPIEQLEYIRSLLK